VFKFTASRRRLGNLQNVDSRAPYREDWSFFEWRGRTRGGLLHFHIDLGVKPETKFRAVVKTDDFVIDVRDLAGRVLYIPTSEPTLQNQTRTSVLCVLYILNHQTGRIHTTHWLRWNISPELPPRHSIPSLISRVVVG